MKRKDFEARLPKVVALVGSGKVRRVQDRETSLGESVRVFKVDSSKPGHDYEVLVTETGGKCSCPWGQHTEFGWDNPCTHLLAAAALADINIQLEGT